MTQGYDPNEQSGQGGYQPPPPPYGQQPSPYGQQPPYGQPQYGGPPVPQYGPGGFASAPATDQLAIISLVVAGVGLVICQPAGIVSLILGLRSLRRIGDSGNTIGGRGVAIAGIIVSIVDIVITIGIILAVVLAIVANRHAGTTPGY